MWALTGVAGLVLMGAVSMESGRLQLSHVEECNQTVVEGTDVHLTCTNRTWSELFYMIWRINLTHGTCEISFSDDGQHQNTCGDGKVLLNTSAGGPYLLVPRVSLQDEGLYHCETAFRMEDSHADLLLSVSPVSAWLGGSTSRPEAVCVVGRWNPSTTVSWRSAGNLTLPVVNTTTLDPRDGSVTLRSTLALPEGVRVEDITCVVDHPCWAEELSVRPVDSRAGRGRRVLLQVVAMMATATLATLGALCWWGRTTAASRLCWRSGCRPSQEARSPPSTEDVEELEPYASYVQRVNSLYSSSADLLT